MIEHPSEHGGEREASYQMYVRPDLVRHDKLADNPRGQATLPSLRNPAVQFVRPWHAHVPVSAGGEQRKASAEKGKAIIESAAANIATLLVELSEAPESADFPY